MTGVTGELSLVLSVEQLVVLGGFLGEPVPTYVTDALEELTFARREAALAVARQSLVERSIVIPGKPFQIPISAARLMQVVCRPELSVVIHHGTGPDWVAKAARIAAVPDASVEVWPDGDAFRLTPLHTEQLLQRISMCCQLAPLPAPSAPVATMPLSLLRAASATRIADSAIGLLKDGGVPDATAESAGVALANGQRFAVSAVLRAGAGKRTGGEVAWAVGEDGYWLLPPALTPLAGTVAGDEGGSAGDEGGPQESDGITVRLLPASGDDLLNALAASLPIET